MAREIVTKSSRFYCVSLSPDICKTPMGNSTPPIPYTIKGEFAQARGVSPNISSHGDKIVLHERSIIPTVTGDGPGSAKGIKSGTVGQKVETKEKSSTVLTNGSRPVRVGDVVKMNDNNTTGKIHERGGEAAKPRIQGSGSTSPASLAAKKLGSLWSKASPWVHGWLGGVSFVPVLSVASSGADALIYTAECKPVEAGVAAIGMIPMGKEATTTAKLLLKGTQKAEEVAQAARKAEAAAKATREAEEAAKAAKEAEEAGKAEKAAAKGKDGWKSKAKKTVPCFHPFDKKKFAKMTPDEQKAYLKEMAEQLKRQQDQINSMSAIEYKAARNAFDKVGRNPLAEGAQESYRKDFAKTIERSIRRSLGKGGMSAGKAKVEAATRTKAVMSKLAALHEPDMVVGGWMHPDPKGMGRADVNLSIGGSWNQNGRIASMDKAADDAIASGRGNDKMNVKLEPCRGKGLK